MKKIILLLSILLAMACCSRSESENKQIPAVKTGVVKRVIKSAPADQEGKRNLPPEDIAREFIEASKVMNKEKLVKVLTAKAAACIDDWQHSGREYKHLKIDAAEIQTDTATVPIHYELDGKRDVMRIVMRQDRGSWRVYALKEKTGEGTDITIDLEKVCDFSDKVFAGVQESLSEGLSDYQRQWVAEKMAEYQAVEATDLGSLNARWQMEVDFKDTSVQKACEELLKPLGLALFTEGFEKQLAQRITLSKQKASRLHIIETILNQAGLYPVYPDLSMGGLGEFGNVLTSVVTGMFDETSGPLKIEQDGKAVTIPHLPDAHSVTLKAGVRPYPVAFVGPLMIETKEVVENAPLPTGHVSIVIWGADIDKSALILLKEDNKAAVIHAAVDDNGKNLLREKKEGYFPPPAVQGSMFRMEKTVQLQNLYRPVKSIHSIQGVFRLRYPAALIEEKMDMPQLRAGVAKTYGKLEFASSSEGLQTRFDIKGPSSLLKHLHILYYPVDRNGRFFGPFSVGTSYSFSTSDDNLPGEINHSLSMEEEPAAVGFKLLTAVEEIQYLFEINQIHLKSYAKMPAGPVAIDFGEHKKPVSVEFRDFDRQDATFPKARLGLKNHANKSILKIEADLCYLDAAGQTLKTLPHEIKGVFTQHSQDAVVEKKSATEVETTAFFLPDNAVGMEVQVKGVEFADYTRWDAQ